jgi:hypothetical protein
MTDNWTPNRRGFQPRRKHRNHWDCPHCRAFNGNMNWECYACGRMPEKENTDEERSDGQ